MNSLRLFRARLKSAMIQIHRPSFRIHKQVLVRRLLMHRIKALRNS